MVRYLPVSALLSALACAPAFAASTVETVPVKPVSADKTDEVTFKVNTHGGLSVESSDGSAFFEVAGRAVFDVNYFDGLYNRDNAGDTGSETELRRFRFGFDGYFAKDWNYEFLVDLADGDRSVEDTVTTIDTAMLQYTGFEYADITVGRFKRPVSLETLTSSNWHTFTEKAMIWDLAPANDIAKGSLMASKLFDIGGGNGFLYEVAVSDDYQENGDETVKTGLDHYALNARGVYTPWATKGEVLHLAASLADQNPGDEATAGVNSRFGVHPATKYALVPSIKIESDRQYGLEALWISGPFSVQSEWIGREIGGRDGDPDVSIKGGYLMGTWTLTGESRGYKRGEGKADKVKPENRSYGAVELAARYQKAWVQADGASEVQANGYQAGVNWYPIRNVKVVLDFTYFDTSGLDTQGAGPDGKDITARVQYVF